MYKIPANTLFLGKNLVFMPECHSTNTFALQLCQETPFPAEGTVVIAARQAQGRGQQGNDWEAEPGKNFTLSMILYPTFLAITNQFYLNIFTALAIQDYLQQKSCANVRIKWPNDVFIGEKKVCGILIENQLKRNLLANTVIGIGLNMNQRQFAVKSATSLGLVLDREFELKDELEILLGRIEARFLQLRHGEFDRLMKDYLKAMLWINEMHIFHAGGVYFEGSIRGIDQSGRLRVAVGNDEKAYGTREISYVQ